MDTKRVIKFRAWDGKNMIINVGFHPFILQRMEGYRDMNDGGSIISPLFTSYTLMQFIGKKDINGIEIYEGDIVEYYQYRYNINEETNDGMNPSVGVIEFSPYCGFGVNGSTLDHREGAGRENYKVIGNIYQNKDLI